MTDTTAARALAADRQLLPNAPRVTGHPDQDEHAEALNRARTIRDAYRALLNIGVDDVAQDGSLIADLLLLAEHEGTDPDAVLDQARYYVDESGTHDQPATQDATQEATNG